MILQRKYTVKGDDVNDFMVMQNSAYLKSATRLITTFLFMNGFTSLKMNSLKVGLENKNDSLTVYKPLFFTQEFFVNLELNYFIETSNKMRVTINFINAQDELSASLTRELFWFDFENWQTITPPNSLLRYFSNKRYKRVG